MVNFKHKFNNIVISFEESDTAKEQEIINAGIELLKALIRRG